MSQGIPPPDPWQPIDYAGPIRSDANDGYSDRGVAPILSIRIALHVWAITAAVLMTTCLGIPKLEGVFRDFKIELPAITQATLLFTRALANDYLWILVALIGLGLPFALSAMLGFGTPSREDVRRREIWLCRGLRLVALLVILWLALAMILPYATLLQSITGPTGKH
jgi:hypothetical protein